MAKESKKEKKAAKKEAKAAKKENKKANGKASDPEFNGNLVKCIFAVLCVLALCITTTSNIGKVADAKIAAAEAFVKDAGENGEAADETGADTGSTDTDAPAADEQSTEAEAGEDATEASSDAEAAPTEAATEAGKTDGGSASKAPKSTDEVLKAYNSATAKAFNAKVPFTKERDTVEKNYKAGAALNASKSIVYKFMGVGDANKFSKTVTKEDKDSYHKYLQASKLTPNDVTSATCTEAGGKYTIVIKIKDGASSVKGGQVVNSNNAPLDRAGLACGDHDKDYWDHKTAENVMSAIAEVPLCGSANINEKYTNASITAVVDAKTGNLVSLTAKFDFHFDLDKVMSSSGTADSSSTVVMKDFKW